MDNKQETSRGINVPVLTYEITAIADQFLWKTIKQIGPDHLLILIMGGLDAKVERDYRASGKIRAKTDWSLTPSVSKTTAPRFWWKNFLINTRPSPASMRRLNQWRCHERLQAGLRCDVGALSERPSLRKRQGECIGIVSGVGHDQRQEAQQIS